jgi:diketogulonate reductase-like aldo/keto reductase
MGTRFPFSGWVCGRSPTGLPRSTPCAGHYSSATATFDTAQVYGNEESVGQALRESGIPRDQVFITTKFNPSRKDAAVAAERSLQRLGTDYVDLYLVHWPQGGATRAWPGMERARELSFARSIGVSNFGIRELDQVLAVAHGPLVVDQVQFSRFEYRRAMLDAT